MDNIEFTEATALAAAKALQLVLYRRRHRKKILGQEIVIPGQLGEAVRLPSIISRLQSKVGRRRHDGLEDFSALWVTLSYPTRESVLKEIGYYDPKDLDWDDPRSNRRPTLGD